MMTENGLCISGKLVLKSRWTLSSPLWTPPWLRENRDWTSPIGHLPRLALSNMHDCPTRLVRYASLYFILGLEDDDNELLGLELIHHLVEMLDRYFGNVCELDLIFNFHKVHMIVDDVIMGKCVCVRKLIVFCEHQTGVYRRRAKNAYCDW